MVYTELTVWTRGIIMDKEGRDIVNSIAASARLEGKFAQAMENYVDNPDRTNAPTRKYCRISDSEIENALTYENEQPNILVLVEQTMVKGWDYMRGMPPGGTLVINTHYTPEYMIRFVPGPERLAQLVCVDAAKIAEEALDRADRDRFVVLAAIARLLAGVIAHAAGHRRKRHVFLDERVGVEILPALDQIQVALDLFVRAARVVARRHLVPVHGPNRTPVARRKQILTLL